MLFTLSMMHTIAWIRSENVLYAQVIVDQMEKSSNRLSADWGLEGKGCKMFVLLTAGWVAILLKQYRNI